MLEITTQPLKQNVETKLAFLEYTNIDRGEIQYKGGLGQYRMHLETLKYRQDSTDFKASIGIKTSEQCLRESGEAGKKAWQECMDKYAEMGKHFGALHKKPQIADFYYNYLPFNRSQSLEVRGTAEVNWWFDPPVKDVEYERHEVEFNYRPWNIDFNFTPPQISYTTEQYPEVKFNVVTDE